MHSLHNSRGFIHRIHEPSNMCIGAGHAQGAKIRGCTFPKNPANWKKFCALLPKNMGCKYTPGTPSSAAPGLGLYDSI